MQFQVKLYFLAQHIREPKADVKRA